MDIDLLHQVAHFPHEAEGVALQLLDGVHDGLGRLGVAGQEPDHQLLRRVMVQRLVLEEVPGPAMEAFPHEERAVPDPGLEVRVLGDVDARVGRDGVAFAAAAASCVHQSLVLKTSPA